MFIEVPFKERIWIRTHCRSQESLLPAGLPHHLLRGAPSKCRPQFLSLRRTLITDPRIPGTCFVQATITKVVCLLGQCTVKYKGKPPLCGNTVGNVLGCLDTRLQNTKPSSLCQFLLSFLKMPKPTNDFQGSQGMVVSGSSIWLT